MNTKKVTKALAALASLAFAVYVISLFAQFDNTVARAQEKWRDQQRLDVQDNVEAVRRALRR